MGTLLSLVAALTGASELLGQINVRRPRLRAQADTNDATAYIRHARNLLYTPTDSAHAAAEAALIWASRIDPGSGDPPYLLAVAVIRPVVVQAFRSGRVSKGLLRREFTPMRLRYLDSLLREAWLREPFYDIDLEPLLTIGLVPAPEGLRDPIARGYAAYHRGYAQLAVDSWREAILKEPARVDLRLHRAHTFYWMQEYDSTVTELRAVLASTIVPDSVLASVLPPRHVLEYALGVALESAGEPDAAKDAYRRALVDHLGLYMARVRLSNLLFASGDTVAALREVALAADIAPLDPWLMSYYGSLLHDAGRPADAVGLLHAAVALDSVYSTPYFMLGLSLSTLGLEAEAVRRFEDFLSRAAVADERRAWATQRVATIRAKLSPPAPPRE